MIPNESHKLGNGRFFHQHCHHLQIMKCLTKAMDVISDNRVSYTPVFLRATAGMRVLEKNNATASQVRMSQF